MIEWVVLSGGPADGRKEAVSKGSPMVVVSEKEQYGKYHDQGEKDDKGRRIFEFSEDTAPVPPVD